MLEFDVPEDATGFVLEVGEQRFPQPLPEDHGEHEGEDHDEDEDDHEPPPAPWQPRRHGGHPH